MTAPLASVRVKGFRSIADLELPLTSAVTLLVGANGSGKSNVIAAFELLGRVIDGSVQEELLRRGGLAAQLHRNSRGDDAHQVEMQVWGDEHGGFKNGYSVTLNPAVDDAVYLRETTYTHEVAKYDRPYESRLGAGRETRLHEAALEHPANRFVLEVLRGCRVFHFDDTSPDAPPFRRASLADNLTLHSDASNIASLLLSIRETDPGRFQRIVRSIRAVAPFFDDFVLVPEGDTVSLRWKEKGIDQVFSGSALSSGSLRFICLAVLLQQPNPPATTVLDEPELGLHPFAIYQLADLMHEAGTDRRIVAATQSVTLLSHFTVDEIAVVERPNGATVVARPQREQLEAWLTDYSLGELWEMNVLGGRPQAPPTSPGTLRTS